MEAITAINSPLSSMSPFIYTIDEHKKSNTLTNCNHSRSSFQIFEKQTQKQCNHSSEQSVVSLSNIMEAFRKASFNLTEKLSLKSFTNVKNGNNDKLKSNNLTLNIVGIRDKSYNDDSINNQITKSQTVNTMIDILKRKEKNNNKNDNEINENKDETKDEMKDDRENDSVTTSNIDSSDNGISPSETTMEDIKDETKEEMKTDIKNIKTNSEIELCLKTIITPLTINNTVGELKEYLKQSNVFNLHKNTIIQCLYSNILLSDEYRTLGYYGICNNSFILTAVLEGKPLNDIEYKEQMEKLKLQRNNDLPAQFNSTQANNLIGNNNNINYNNNHNNNNDERFAALRLFTQRHVQNVRNGNVQTTVNVNTEKKRIEVKILDFKQMCDDFEIERTTSFDFLTFETIDNCVKMPCGHGICEDSLMAYVLSEVKSKNTMNIHCPQLIKDSKTGKETPCKAIWHYPIIKKVLLNYLKNENENKNKNKNDNDKKFTLKKEDLLNFLKIELLLSRNIIQDMYDVQKCGHCHSVQFRKQETDSTKKLKDFQAICSLCTMNNRKKYILKNENKIKLIEKEIKELKKPKIFKKMNEMKKSFSEFNLKNKLNDIFIESWKYSPNEIESNKKKYHSSKKKLHFKKYRKSKKQLRRNVIQVPKSFLNSFKTDSDLSSDSENEIINNHRLKKVKILNPYLSIVNDEFESSDYEYVTTDTDISTNNDNDNGNDNDSKHNTLFDSDSSDDSDIEPTNNNGNNNNINNNNNTGTTVINNNNGNNNNTDTDESDIETEVIANERINMFKSESDSESEDDGKISKTKNNNENISQKKVIKSEYELKLEKLESQLLKLRNDSFDKIEYNIIFCWGCSVAWMNGESSSCGNNECSTSFRSQILSILSDCDLKTIGSQKLVPSVRACPKCGQLINHWEACKHMQCQQCQTQFCFVCLKKYIKDSGWQCGSYSDKCPAGIKSRQTCESLPSMNVATVSLYEF